MSEETHKTLMHILKTTVLCPKCDQAITKSGGCDHLKCKCGTNFCWVCLKTFEYMGDHIQEYDDIGGYYVCNKTQSKDRGKLLKKSRAKIVKKLFGTTINVDEIDNLYDKIHDLDTTDYDVLRKRNRERYDSSDSDDYY